MVIEGRAVREKFVFVVKGYMQKKIILPGGAGLVEKTLLRA